MRRESLLLVGNDMAQGISTHTYFSIFISFYFIIIIFLKKSRILHLGYHSIKCAKALFKYVSNLVTR